MLKEFLQKSFENAILLGQTKVSDNQFNERVAVCKGCPHLGKVQPLPTLEFNEGCTLCHCPLITKAKLINHSLLGSASCELGKWEKIDKKYNGNS
jgi:hypothetical protein